MPCYFFAREFGGGRGIRTPGGFPHSCFQDNRHRPLGHPSRPKDIISHWLKQYTVDRAGCQIWRDWRAFQVVTPSGGRSCLVTTTSLARHGQASSIFLGMPFRQIRDISEQRDAQVGKRVVFIPRYLLPDDIRIIRTHQSQGRSNFQRSVDRPCAKTD